MWAQTHSLSLRADPASNRPELAPCGQGRLSLSLSIQHTDLLQGKTLLPIHVHHNSCLPFFLSH